MSDLFTGPSATQKPWIEQAVCDALWRDTESAVTTTPRLGQIRRLTGSSLALDVIPPVVRGGIIRPTSTSRLAFWYVSDATTTIAAVGASDDTHLTDLTLTGLSSTVIRIHQWRMRVYQYPSNMSTCTGVYLELHAISSLGQCTSILGTSSLTHWWCPVLDSIAVRRALLARRERDVNQPPVDPPNTPDRPATTTLSDPPRVSFTPLGNVEQLFLAGNDTLDRVVGAVLPPPSDAATLDHIATAAAAAAVNAHTRHERTTVFSPRWVDVPPSPLRDQAERRRRDTGQSGVLPFVAVDASRNAMPLGSVEALWSNTAPATLLRRHQVLNDAVRCLTLDTRPTISGDTRASEQDNTHQVEQLRPRHDEVMADDDSDEEGEGNADMGIEHVLMDATPLAPVNQVVDDGPCNSVGTSPHSTWTSPRRMDEHRENADGGHFLPQALDVSLALAPGSARPDDSAGLTAASIPPTRQVLDQSSPRRFVNPGSPADEVDSEALARPTSDANLDAAGNLETQPPPVLATTRTDGTDSLDRHQKIVSDPPDATLNGNTPRMANGTSLTEPNGLVHAGSASRQRRGRENDSCKGVPTSRPKMSPPPCRLAGDVIRLLIREAMSAGMDATEHLETQPPPVLATMRTDANGDLDRRENHVPSGQPDGTLDGTAPNVANGTTNLTKPNGQTGSASWQRRDREDASSKVVRPQTSKPPFRLAGDVIRSWLHED